MTQSHLASERSPYYVFFTDSFPPSPSPNMPMTMPKRAITLFHHDRTVYFLCPFWDLVFTSRTCWQLGFSLCSFLGAALPQLTIPGSMASSSSWAFYSFSSWFCHTACGCFISFVFVLRPDSMPEVQGVQGNHQPSGCVETRICPGDILWIVWL